MNTQKMGQFKVPFISTIIRYFVEVNIGKRVVEVKCFHSFYFAQFFLFAWFPPDDIIPFRCICDITFHLLPDPLYIHRTQ